MSFTMFRFQDCTLIDNSVATIYKVHTAAMYILLMVGNT